MTMASDARRDAVERFAEEILERHQVRAAPIDVEEIARAEGLMFLRMPFTVAAGAYVGVVRDDEPAQAFVGDRLSVPRRRFTMAHELAHHLIDGQTRWLGRGELTRVVVDP